jgi:hypothetical protein
MRMEVIIALYFLSGFEGRRWGGFGLTAVEFLVGDFFIDSGGTPIRLCENSLPRLWQRLLYNRKLINAITVPVQVIVLRCRLFTHNGNK